MRGRDGTTSDRADEPRRVDDPLAASALARFGTERWRAGGIFRDLSISPDGTRVAAAANDALHVWDAATGRALLSPRVAGSPRGEIRRANFVSDDLVAISTGFGEVRVWSLAESRDVRAVPISVGGCYGYAVSSRARLAATLLTDGSVGVWDLNTGERRSTLALREPWSANQFVFSPDGERLATGHERGLALWDVVTGGLVRQLAEGMGAAQSIAFSPDGSRLVATTPDNHLALWDLATFERTPIERQGLFQKLRFSPDGRTLALLRSDCVLYLWSLSEGRVVFERPDGRHGWCGAIEYLPDGRALACAIDGCIAFFDGSTGERLDPPEARTTAVTAVSLRPDGREVTVTRGEHVATYAATGEMTSEHTSAKSGEGVGGRVAPSLPTARSADGARSASVEPPRPREKHCTLLVHDGEDPAPRWTAPIKGCQRLVLSADGASVAFAVGTAVQVHDGATGELRAKLRVPSAVCALALSRSGDLLAVGMEDGQVFAFRVPERKPCCTLGAHLGPVTALAVSDDGRRIVSGSRDTTAALWEVPAPSARPAKGRRTGEAGAPSPPRSTKQRAAHGRSARST